MKTLRPSRPPYYRCRLLEPQQTPNQITDPRPAVRRTLKSEPQKSHFQDRLHVLQVLEREILKAPYSVCELTPESVVRSMLVLPQEPIAA